MQDVLSLAIVGVILSGLVQFIKSSAELKGWKTTAVLVFGSLLAGSVYYIFRDNVALWKAMVQILVYANSFYGLILSRFE